ncbi:AMP-binding protein [Gilvimarinus sp. SDUM040013]|uniref:AMP-binding protein n=1 Tax=Gilvimarinus gilvus TaxID=3058038 RepID=A0ABU4S1V8_9GAMM|nr:AMP-binding protein [Gilvimarinus sp. SDUM040013]MDO3387795.1 AMP-binding protein [Gilvimarinus sp. SDUM040013]MDX6851062.1 AMP-binding protein [Gilvimarinus sp. SDUM040013]
MTEPLDIGYLALQGGDHIVAVDGDTVFSADDFKQRVERFYASIAQQAEHSVGLWLSSPWDFLCIFAALALAGKRIVMPHNLQAGAAGQMNDYFSALITDQPLPALDCPQWHPAGLLATTAKPEALQALSESAGVGSVEMILFTSGTTSEPTPVRKTLADLHGELVELEQAFAGEVQQHPVLATVSHQHIYGLLHVLLWPLVRRAPFAITACHYPEVLAEQAEKLAPVVLVSSPTHLSRLPQSEPFCAQAGAFSSVFSSGGLLAKTDALAITEVLGRAPIEVLGSTETGGVAYRRQNESECWTALPNVSVDQSPNGCLRVRGNHLGGLPEFVMGDRVELQPDGRFLLLGRADTVVKVEGKRLSLNEMQTRLNEHEWVLESRVAIVRGRRDEVGVVAALTQAGLDAIAVRGKRPVNIILKRHLQDYFELPLLPRRWRYLDAMPRNTQGKILAVDIQNLLEARV